MTKKIRPDYKRLLDLPMRHWVTVDCTQPGTALRRAIKGFVRMKCHSLVLVSDGSYSTALGKIHVSCYLNYFVVLWSSCQQDSSLNTFPTVVRTVYTIFLVAAMRTHAYVR
jgi:hypothetical protein